MSRLFSTVEFNDAVYVFPGKVDTQVLANFEPLIQTLCTMEKTESLYVWVSALWAPNIDNDESNRDLYESEVDDIVASLAEMIEADQLSTEEEVYYKFYGILEQPFEDAYALEGTEREEYLYIHNLNKRYEALKTSELQSEGMSELDIALWFRYNSASLEEVKAYVEQAEREGTVDADAIAD